MPSCGLDITLLNSLFDVVALTEKHHYFICVNIMSTSSVVDTAKRTRNWGEGTSWTVVAHRTRPISGEVVRALWCWSYCSALAEITLQT